MPIRYLISDIDGCLSPEESIPWDEAAFARFISQVRASQRGAGPLVPMTLCTGRPQPYVEVLMKQLDIHAPAVCENGAVIYTLADNYARYARGVTHEKIVGLRAVRAFIEEELLPVHASAVVQFGKEAQISVYSEQPEIFPALQARIEEFIARRGGPAMLINSSHFYLNISLLGVDKGSALREVQADLGLPSAECAGIGDTEGDLPLREAVGWFACPANARDSIKAVADYVSPYPTIAGVLDILQRPELRRA